jgi:glycosyltransferase involved in cell wall biosynthesis
MRKTFLYEERGALAMMLSIIVCSRDAAMCARLERNVARTIGVDHEFIRVNNETNQRGICAAYNEGMRHAKGDYFLFVHEDVLFITQDWGVLLAEDFGQREAVCVGIAGSEVLPKSNAWFRAGQPYIHGHFVMSLNQQQDLEIHNAPNIDIAEGVSLDGVFIAVQAALARELRFDDEHFPAFDFYDADFTLRCAEHGRLLIDPRIFLKHFSRRGFADDYFFHPVFQALHGARLPYSKIGVTELEGRDEVEIYSRSIPILRFPEED